MKIKSLFMAFLVLAAVLIASRGFAQEYQNRYVTDSNERVRLNTPVRYLESANPVYSDKDIAANDPHIRIIGWDPAVPAKRFINTIQEGVTDQNAILKFLSAPQIMTRYPPPHEKQTWVYYWLWTYEDEQDPNRTLIYMDKPGLRVKRNKKPVVMSITFNEKDIVESYSIKLLKVKKDMFNSQ